MQKPIYVFGHKNPDPDSICAAIAYADFKQQLGCTHYIPARCGNSNARIDAIVECFGVTLPVLITDVRPRVKDIMVQNTQKVYPSSTCAEALKLMDTHDLRSLPVVDEANRLQGMISIFDISAQLIANIQSPAAYREVQTTLQAILRTLNAQPVHLINPDVVETVYVRVAAMHTDTFGTFIGNAQVPLDQSIIVVGDRPDIHAKAIDLGVRLIVLTGGATLSNALLAQAKAKQVSVMISPDDSASTTWMLKTASLITPWIEPITLQFEPEDILTHARSIVAKHPSMNTYVVVNADKKLCGVFTKSDWANPPTLQIALVDHNELTQAVDGAAEATITEIVDHHRLGNPPTQQPIFFYNAPVGSTCTLIAQMYQRYNLQPSAAIAGLMMAGLITDTYLLKGPTTTPQDVAILPWLESIAGMTGQALADKVFSTGSLIVTLPPEQVIHADAKVYEEYGVRYSVGQIEEVGFDTFWKHSEALYAALDSYRVREKLYVSLLLITDIATQNSVLMVSGCDTFISQIQAQPLVPKQVFDFPGIVSRKKQLIPYVTQLVQAIQSPS